MDALADRVIRAPVTAEAHWREWLATRAPVLALDDWLHVHERLVVVAPHPDDEVLACGGLLNLHTERGCECAVIAVTDGDASHAGCADWSGPRLAEARRAESERGLAQLGVPSRAITRLGLPDGKVAERAPQLLDALCSRLRTGDVVVATWRLDGHPDHDATGYTAAQACAAIGARFVEAPVWMWHWARPDDARVPWDRLRVLLLSPPAFDRKAAALAEHVSQLTPRRRNEADAAGAAGNRRDGPVLDAGILQRAARRCEYFFV